MMDVQNVWKQTPKIFCYILTNILTPAGTRYPERITSDCSFLNVAGATG